ncbi:MAG: TRIC cation channel family protein [Coriobacteriia bacterium]|nr:TRIC cation channel family protein [Coriobacteriia bacterium]
MLQSYDLIEGALSNIVTSTPANTSTINIPVVMEYFAVVIGCMYGGSVAFDRDLDILGCLVISVITGFGGGIIRDVLLPSTSIYFLDTPTAILIGVIAGLVVYFFRSIMVVIDRPLIWADIISVALFVFVGAEKGIALGYSPLSCIVLGFITGSGGGFLRDISMGDMPVMFKAGYLYALAGLIGSITYVTLIEFHVVKTIAFVLCIITVVGLRYVSLRFNLRTQTPVDYSQHIVKPIKRIFRYEDGSQEIAEKGPETTAVYKDNPANLLVIDRNEILVVHEISDTSSEEVNFSDIDNDNF